MDMQRILEEAGLALTPNPPHTLKTDPDVFQASARGDKTYEIRFDDRGYVEGDYLLLLETVHTGQEMAAGAPLEYTGARLLVSVTHILRGPVYGLSDGWVLLSFKRFGDTSENTNVTTAAAAIQPRQGLPGEHEISCAVRLAGLPTSIDMASGGTYNILPGIGRVIRHLWPWQSLKSAHRATARATEVDQLRTAVMAAIDAMTCAASCEEAESLERYAIDLCRDALSGQPEGHAAQPPRAPFAPTEQDMRAYAAKASQMMADNQTRFDAAVEVQSYLRSAGAPQKIMHRIGVVLHGPEKPKVPAQGSGHGNT